MNKPTAVLALAILTGAFIGIAIWEAYSYFNDADSSRGSSLVEGNPSTHKKSDAHTVAGPTLPEGIDRAGTEDSRSAESDRAVSTIKPDTKIDFNGEEIFVNGISLSDINIETWNAEELSTLRNGIRPWQLKACNDVKERVPVEHLFVTNEDYTGLRRWHEDMVFYAAQRAAPEGSEHEFEYGVIEVSRALSPESYILRDAIVRSYRAPASAQELMDKGIAYEATVMARHPDAIADITDDLTRWTYFSPDGEVVGMTTNTRFANH